MLIFISVFLGLCIGAEREYRNKSAGLRTFILACFGSALFTILSIKIGIVEQDRIAANIITGIGFLGAGVIFKGDNKIDGITTATTIWATASIGMAVGAGYVYLAVLGTVLVLLILNSLNYFQNLIDRHHKIREYKIEVNSENELTLCENYFNENKLKATVEKMTYSKEKIRVIWKITGKSKDHQELIDALMTAPYIQSFEF